MNARVLNHETDEAAKIVVKVVALKKRLAAARRKTRLQHVKIAIVRHAVKPLVAMIHDLEARASAMLRRRRLCQRMLDGRRHWSTANATSSGNSRTSTNQKTHVLRTPLPGPCLPPPVRPPVPAFTPVVHMNMRGLSWRQKVTPLYFFNCLNTRTKHAWHCKPKTRLPQPQRR